jgi:hypothetical protein
METRVMQNYERTYKNLAQKIKVNAGSIGSFCVNALEWLAGYSDNLNVEYTYRDGWRISCSTKHGKSISMTGETLFIAVCRTVEAIDIPMEFKVGNKYKHKVENVTVVYTGETSGVVVSGDHHPIGEYRTDWTFSANNDMWREVK